MFSSKRRSSSVSRAKQYDYRAMKISHNDLSFILSFKNTQVQSLKESLRNYSKEQMLKQKHENSSKEQSLKNTHKVIAFIDFANIAYSIDILPSGDRHNFVFNEYTANKYIEKLINYLTDYIKELPQEVEKVVIFATEKDDNLYKLKLNKHILPFKFNDDQLKKMHFEKEYEFDIENSFFDIESYEQSLEDFHEQSLKNKILKNITLKGISQEQVLKNDSQEQVLKNKTLKNINEQVLKESLIKSSKDSLKNITQGQFFKDFHENHSKEQSLKELHVIESHEVCPQAQSLKNKTLKDIHEQILNDFHEFPLTSKPSELLIPYENLDKELQNDLKNMSIELTQIISLPKLSKFKLNEKCSNYARKYFTKYIRIPDIINQFHVNIIEKVKYNISKISSKQHIEIIHIESPLEDDLTMRLYAIDLLNKLKKPYDIYVYSNDRDTLSNFSSINNVTWISYYNPYEHSLNDSLEKSSEDSLNDSLEKSSGCSLRDITLKDSYKNDFEEQFLKNITHEKSSKDSLEKNSEKSSKEQHETRISIDVFWSNLLDNHVISDYSKRIIWGFLGSDYTTPIMNKYDIHRLVFNNKMNPYETLKKYINRRFIDGEIKYLNNNVTDESIIDHVNFMY